MELVHDPVHDRRENDGGTDDEDQAGVEGKHAGEDFAAGSLRRSKRPHAGQDHRGVGVCVNGRQAFKVTVAGHAQQLRQDNQHRCDTAEILAAVE